MPGFRGLRFANPRYASTLSITASCVRTLAMRQTPLGQNDELTEINASFTNRGHSGDLSPVRIVGSRRDKPSRGVLQSIPLS